MAAVKLKTVFRGLWWPILGLVLIASPGQPRTPGSSGYFMDGSLGAEEPAPEKTRLARGYLQQAIAEYKTGRPDRARFHWRLAGDLAPRWAGKRADYNKLDGLLLLGEGRDAAAMKAFTLSLRARPDPFLHYLQGNYYLKYRNPRQARVAYNGALAAFFSKDNSNRKPLPSPEYSLPGRLPLVCPGDDPRKYKKWLAATLKNRFAATEWSAVHWGRTLSREELVLSILQSMLLTGYFEGKESRALAQYRGWLRAIKLEEEEVYFAATLSLIRRPLGDENHVRCLHGLEALKRQQERIIAGGSSEPAARHLQTIKEYLRRAHWNRIATRGDVGAYYSYGSYLMREGKATEALHNFRRALALTEYELRPDLDGRSLHEAAQTYRQIQFAYKRMGKVKDAETVGEFATLLEELSFKIKSDAPGAAAAVDRTRRELVKRARSNYHNREGLVFLIRHADTFKGESRAKLRSRLAERDEREDEAELMSAFGYLYAN